MKYRFLRKSQRGFVSSYLPTAARIEVFESQITKVVYWVILKRTIDIAVSGLALALLSPLLLVIAILVKLDSKGPVFYSQVRVGLNRRVRYFRVRASGNWDRRTESNYGRPFHILKFRSMTVDAEKGKAVWCKVNDPRVTRMGNILRKTHLDELPQLFNILKGDMTLVGPRPERPELIGHLISKIPAYKNRLEIKPGLTGLAQIYHRADLDIEDVKRKLRYDRVYSQSISLSTDMKIVFGTIPFMLGMENDRMKRSNNLSRSGEPIFPAKSQPVQEPVWDLAGLSKN